MAELHESLKTLGPVNWTDVPITDLTNYLKSHLEAGELICNSVPQPPGGDPFESSRPAQSERDAAASSKDISVSSARAPPPHDSHASLQDAWGKPFKLSAKENPLDVKVYKMAAHDRHGAWFARRSVHEGISFSKLRKAMKWEFLESMAVQGGPGAGAVRGLAVDTRLEKHKVGQLGQLDVYQLSAQFAGPTTPREFISLIMTSEHALTEKSAVDGTHIPRHFMIVSRPCDHPDAPERAGYIRGTYESVEMIREIPLHKRSDKAASTSDLLAKHSQSHMGRDRGATISFAESRGREAKGEQVDGHATSEDDGDPELNPVEWIMITRSDPGGGIPRFMVERGTPGGICGDVTKLFDWACGKEDIPDADEEEVEAMVDRRNSEAAAASVAADAQQPGDAPGLLATAQEALENYAPAAVTTYLGSASQQPRAVEDLDDSSSTTSYESADDHIGAPARSADSLPSSDTLLSDGSAPSVARAVTGIEHHDKEIQKLEAQKKKLELKLNKKRETEASKISSLQGKNESDANKARERHSREMKKLDERRNKELSKLEERREREVEKAKRKREKQRERDMVGRVSRERDDYRRRVELVQRENELLREQIGEVQKENTVLVQRLSKLAGGDVAVEAVRGELGKKKAGSVRSGKGGGERPGSGGRSFSSSAG